MDPETDDELPKTDEAWRTFTNHRYNLRPRPSWQNKKYIITKNRQQSHNKKIGKPNTHVKVMQLNIKKPSKSLAKMVKSY